MAEQALTYRYQFIDELGKGTTFIVYKARDRLIGRVVALKIVRDTWARNESFREKFLKVLEPCLNIPHPNLVRYLNVGETEDALYLSCEYVPGENLSEVLKRHVFVSITQALRIGIQICDALSQLHEMGIVHGDVRPQHVLVTHRGEAKLSDYGMHELISSERLLEAEWVRRAIYYLPPERLEEDVVEPPSDIYSLGIMLFETVSGVLPFRGESMTEIATKHVEEKPPLPSDLNPAVPRVVEEVILHAIEKDPAQRFASAREMGDALREATAALDQTAISAPTITPPTVPAESEVERESPNMRFIGKALLVIIGSFVGVVLLALLLWWLLVRTAPPEVPVPNVIGMSLADAERALNESGLYMHVAQKQYSEKVPANHILKLVGVEPGKIVRRGRVIDVIVSEGPELVLVPNVLDLPLEAARERIKTQGLVPEVTAQTYSEEVAKGRIVGQQPPHGYQLPRGQVVQLVVSRGHPPQPREPTIPPGCKAARVIISVGKGPLSQPVEIQVLDATGTHTVYKANHTPGDTIRYTVIGRGDRVIVRVFINGKMAREEYL